MKRDVSGKIADILETSRGGGQQWRNIGHRRSKIPEIPFFVILLLAGGFCDFKVEIIAGTVLFASFCAKSLFFTNRGQQILTETA